jgi:plastocyanin
MSNPDTKPVFDTNDIEELGGEAELVFDAAGDFPYFCRHHPEMTGIVHVIPGGPDPVNVTIVNGPPMAFSPAEITVGIGGTVKWTNNTDHHHTVTSTAGATMSTHCINGRGFVGNTPTIVGRTGQRIRWYVYNLDTSPTWHNFHPHAMRWKFGGEAVDGRSLGPAESFVVEAEIPPVLLLTADEEKAQLPEHRPPGATLRNFKGDFLFHCHVHHHMMNGMVGLVRARQSVWLTDDMAHEISHRTGLPPIDDGSNACPEVHPHPCQHLGGRWEEIAGAPEKPSCIRSYCRIRNVFCSGATPARISRACGITRLQQALTCYRRISQWTLPDSTSTLRICGLALTPFLIHQRAAF